MGSTSQSSVRLCKITRILREEDIIMLYTITQYRKSAKSSRTKMASQSCLQGCRCPLHGMHRSFHELATAAKHSRQLVASKVFEDMLQVGCPNSHYKVQHLEALTSTKQGSTQVHSMPSPPHQAVQVTGLDVLTLSACFQLSDSHVSWPLLSWIWISACSHQLLCRCFVLIALGRRAE